MKKYYKNIDYIRTIACIAILLYHLGILKGGYLAVCTFFVLSGYLSVISCFKKKPFSLKEYYVNKLKKIYVPLLITVFVSIAIVSLNGGMNWLNLKQETTSVLGGYNNFWQLNANLDYFVRHVNSPFIHLWYIAILLQFDLVFPFLFIGFRKIGKHLNRYLPAIITGGLAIISYQFFYKTVKDGNLMQGYYNTFTRLFSLLFGVALGFFHAAHHSLVFKNKKLNQLMFGIDILILIIIFVLVDFKSSWFALSMFIVTVISMRLIDYGTVENNSESNLDGIMAAISKVSYEIYLVQYPVIFLFQDLKITDWIKIPIMIIITIISAYILHYSINIKKKNKFKIIQILSCIALVLFSTYGLYQYIITKDNRAEMKKLEADLNHNRELIKQKQKEYEEKLKNEEDEWQKILSDLDSNEEKIKEATKNIKIVGIGDSVMELAVKELYKQFPNGYFDAVVNRTEAQATTVINDLKSKNMLGDILLINIGTNGDCSVKAKEKLAKAIPSDQKTYWVNATHADCSSFNEDLDKALEGFDNIKVIDWVSVVKEHPEYVISDKVHPTVTGCKVYVQTIFDAIANDYLKDFNKQKEETIKEHDKAENSKVTFVGNDLLLGLYDNLQSDFNNSEMITDKDFTYNTLKGKLEKVNLSNNLVLVFDNSLKLTSDQINNLLKIKEGLKLYVVSIGNSINVENDDIKIIDFSKEFKNKKYLMSDGKHLNAEGNKELSKKIKKVIEK